MSRVSVPEANPKAAGVAPSSPGDWSGLRSASRAVELPGGPRSLLERLGPDGFAWCRDGSGFVTAGVAARVPVAPGPSRFAVAALDVATRLGAISAENPLGWPGTGPVALGALPFEEHLPGELVIPAVVFGVTADGRGWITETGPVDSPAASWSPQTGGLGAIRNGRGPEPAVVREHPGPEAWARAVGQVLDGIARGDLRKVVLAREVIVEAGVPFDRVSVLEHLVRTHPSCFTYAYGDFVGASPELLVARRGEVVTSRPMAGSVTRGATRGEDERLAAGLRSSPKESAEHRLLVDEVVAALAPACSAAPAVTTAEVVRLATVSHLATGVSGRLRVPAPSALALAGLLHPTPAVGGLPRRGALAAIAALEGFERGLYAGPVGWVDAAGDGEWAVALRSATLDGTRARLVAGAGIVEGSDPESEWRETEAKLAPMLAALGVTLP